MVVATPSRQTLALGAVIRIRSLSDERRRSLR